jgi:hypothetical protein
VFARMLRQFATVTLVLCAAAGTAAAQDTAGRLRDRGTGVPTSMFGTYIDKGQWIVYPFFEYYRDGNYEYEPGEFGYGDTTEFRGRYRAYEGLIGTPDWEFKLGSGMIRGLSWGTITVRAAVAHSGGSFEVGEYAFEYLCRVSKRLRLFAAIEGSEDEVEAIGEMQIFLRRNIILKLNSAVGVTSKAPWWAPEVGVMFVFP